MTKQEEFLWCVQAMITLDSHNITLDLDPSQREKISVTGRMETIIYAIRASRHIPERYTAEQAAHEFFYWLKSLDRDSNEKLPQPAWLPSAELKWDFSSR